jgi:hypothetical protein
MAIRRHTPASPAAGGAEVPVMTAGADGDGGLQELVAPLLERIISQCSTKSNSTSNIRWPSGIAAVDTAR